MNKLKDCFDDFCEKNGCEYKKSCEECALKYAYNKALDDFHKELCKATETAISVGWVNGKDVVTMDKIHKIAEKLKAGGKHD